MDPSSSEEFNPYAAPGELEAEDKAIADLMQMVKASEGLWRDGRFLIIRRGTVLPPICVKTGIPAKRSLEVVIWNRTWLPWLGFLIGCLPGYFLFTLLEDSRAFRVYLCEDEFRKLNFEALQAAGFFVLAVIIAFLGMLFPVLFAPAVLMMVGCVAKIIVSRRPLKFHKFTSHYTAVSGAGEGFLQQLPEMPSVEKALATDQKPS